MFKLTRFLAKTLSFRLSLMVIVALAALLIVALLVVFFFSRKMVREEALQDAKQTLEATVQRLDNILLDVEQSSGNIYWRMINHVNHPEEMQVYTDKLVESNPYITNTHIIWDTDSDATAASDVCWNDPSSSDSCDVTSFLLPIYNGQKRVATLSVDVSLSLLSRRPSPPPTPSVPSWARTAPSSSIPTAASSTRTSSNWLTRIPQ